MTKPLSTKSLGSNLLAAQVEVQVGGEILWSLDLDLLQPLQETWTGGLRPLAGEGSRDPIELVHRLVSKVVDLCLEELFRRHTTNDTRGTAPVLPLLGYDSPRARSRHIPLRRLGELLRHRRLLGGGAHRAAVRRHRPGGRVTGAELSP